MSENEEQAVSNTKLCDTTQLDFVIWYKPIIHYIVYNDNAKNRYCNNLIILDV